ncbi:MAG: hypothetical protein GY898_08965, partial [Proteobacteria bacterium]|nr:hypothetical protein [Pseudomonadota bacterium]
SGGYQDSDARNAISVSGDLSYNATTGVISYTATPHFSGAYADLTGKPTLLTNLDGTVKQDIIPDTNIAYDIGSDTKRFKDLYLSGNTISLGSALMSASSSGGISLPSGTTIGPATYGDFRPIKITDGRGINPNFNGNPVVANSTIIDQATYLNAVGSFPDTNFVPSVYSATQDGSNNITAITIVTANEYGSELQDYPGINTDYLMAIDAGIDITNPAEIAASSQQVELSAGVISASIGGTSFDGAYSSLSGKPTIPTAVSELTNDSGFITTDTDTTYTAGSGLTLVGTEFSNTAPDQTVALTGSGATTITGTYPNFTIASTDTDTNTTYTAGTNVTISGANEISSTDTNTTYTSGDFTHNSLSGVSANEHIDWTTDQGSTNIHASNYTNTDTNTTYTAGTGLTLVGTEFQNTSPDQTVSLTGTGATTVTGTYPNFTIDSTDTIIPPGQMLNWDTAFAWGDHSTQGYLTSTTAHYTDSDVDTHLNTGTATANQALVWTGTDYDWVTSTDSDTTYTAGTNITIDGSNV